MTQLESRILELILSCSIASLLMACRVLCSTEPEAVALVQAEIEVIPEEEIIIEPESIVVAEPKSPSEARTFQQQDDYTNLDEEMYYDSLEYLAACVEAEAGNQSEMGKRLVCDVVINRFNSGDYENYYEVINEPKQFSCVADGRIEKVVPSEETYSIVAQELEHQTNTSVMFFRTGGYHACGKPLLKEGDHYFNTL